MSAKSKYMSLGFLLLFGAHLLGASNGVETDSTKGKYALNDPRNPNCPCHKYQQQADKEYAKLIASGANNGNVETKGDDFGDIKKIKKLHSRKRFWGPARNHKVQDKKKKAFRDRLSRCFHF